MKQIKHIKELGGSVGGDKKGVYIAGKVTGLPQKEVEQKFAAVQRELEKAGYEVINPVQIVHPHTPHRQAMRICVNQLAKADYIYLLPDWNESKGARMEKQIADMLQIPLFNA